jgi:hypothetical protein
MGRRAYTDAEKAEAKEKRNKKRREAYALKVGHASTLPVVMDRALGDVRRLPNTNPHKQRILKAQRQKRWRENRGRRRLYGPEARHWWMHGPMYDAAYQGRYDPQWIYKPADPSDPYKRRANIHLAAVEFTVENLENNPNQWVKVSRNNPEHILLAGLRWWMHVFQLKTLWVKYKTLAQLQKRLQFQDTGAYTPWRKIMEDWLSTKTLKYDKDGYYVGEETVYNNVDVLRQTLMRMQLSTEMHQHPLRELQGPVVHQATNIKPAIRYDMDTFLTVEKVAHLALQHLLSTPIGPTFGAVMGCLRPSHHRIAWFDHDGRHYFDYERPQGEGDEEEEE